MFLFLLTAFVSLGFASEPTCGSLVGSIDYSAYSQLRADQKPESYNVSVVTSYQGRSWTFRVGGSAKQYLESSSVAIGAQPPPSKLLWIQQEAGSPKVYLLVYFGRDLFARSRLIEFDLRSRKSKLLVDADAPLYSEKLIISKESDLAIFKASYASNNGNRFETTTYVQSWMIRLSDGQIKTVVHSEERMGLSPAGRAQIKHLRASTSNGDISSVTIDGKVYYRGTSEWIRNGQFLITVTAKTLHVWRPDATTMTLVETSASELGEEVIFTYLAE